MIVDYSHRREVTKKSLYSFFFTRKIVSLPSIMTKRKKKKKIKWSGVALLVLILATILAAVVSLIWWLGSLLVGWIFPNDSHSSPIDSVELVDPALILQDSIRAAEVGTLVKNAYRLDSTLLGLYVYDATTHQTVYEVNADKRFIPASCMKIPTAIAALERLGMDHRYVTTLQVRGDMVGDTLVGELLLQADDDPMILTLDSLVGMMQETGIRAVRGRLAYDLSREDALSSHPSTKTWDIKSSRVPTLLKGRAFVQDAFRAALSRRGVAVIPDSTVAREGAWREVSRQETALTDVLSPMLQFSSNVKAEAVFYHLDRAEGLIRDRQMHWEHPHAVEDFWHRFFLGESQFMGLKSLKMQGVVINDGSGLSPQNRLSPRLLVEMLQYAWNRDSLRNYLIDEGLATPGEYPRRGSLSGRMSSPIFRNRVFVKTGTLTSEAVSSLAGFIHSSDEHWYIFAIINQRCPVSEGRIFQDDFCRLFVRQNQQK